VFDDVVFMTDIFLELRKDHDVESYKAAYIKEGFVRIERLFPETLAEQIHQILVNQTPWHLVHAMD